MRQLNSLVAEITSFIPVISSLVLIFHFIVSYNYRLCFILVARFPLPFCTTL